ncbi:hypothetical protein ACQPXB_37200 [Amycolatopsis sp. CA-161197]|uniref:hypothetical protein n=1 Tax=Amycolatopsis sp. CA-161197 TaxID=3239922 RepID=UPI003D924990
MTAPILLPIDVPTGEIAVRGPFDLSAASRYLAGFGPAGRPDAASESGVLRLAFPVDGVWTHAGAAIRQRSPGTVEVEVSAPVDLAARVMGQVSRMLSLDVDASGLPDIDLRSRRFARRASGFAPCVALLALRSRLLVGALPGHALHHGHEAPPPPRRTPRRHHRRR